jgi:hypothetical protein
MNANALARHYASLTPEERFRLVLAASARGDEPERGRLVNAGQRLTLTMSDHAPYGQAFFDLALLTFIELLEAAAHYNDALDRADSASDVPGGQDDEEEERHEGQQGDDDEAAKEAGGEPAEGGRPKRPVWERTLDLALAAGFVLRTKADGWKLFCEGMNAPPFWLWEGLPGFDRLRRALALTEQAAFVPEGFLRWLNDVRPAGKPELLEVPFTAEGVADTTATMFEKCAAWWGG